jgi:hypothetical protein
MSLPEPHPRGLPWLYRPLGGRIKVKMPYDKQNFFWFRRHLGSRVQPFHVGAGVWAVARPHLRCLVDGLVTKFGHLHVVLDFRKSQQCDTRCRDAQGDDCECSCLGVNHQGAAWWRNWIEVGDTTLITAGDVVRREVTLQRNQDETR